MQRMFLQQGGTTCAVHTFTGMRARWALTTRCAPHIHNTVIPVTAPAVQPDLGRAAHKYDLYSNSDTESVVGEAEPALVTLAGMVRTTVSVGSRTAACTGTEGILGPRFYIERGGRMVNGTYTSAYDSGHCRGFVFQ